MSSDFVNQFDEKLMKLYYYGFSINKPIIYQIAVLFFELSQKNLLNYWRLVAPF